MISNFGKSLEATVRKIRPYLGPSYRTAYKNLVARGLTQRHPSEPIVCCDFSDPAIDAVGGRYYFSLVRDLIDAGYFPVFIAHRATLSTFGTSRMKSILLKERLGVVDSLTDLQEHFYLLTDSLAAAPPLAEKVIHVSYETRLCKDNTETAFPVFVHPQITSKVALPYHYDVIAERTARIFFGGNTEEGKYDKNVIRDTYQMLSRREVLTAASALQDSYRPPSADAWLSSAEFHPYVLCETQHCKIPQERWLDALAKSDFFLACPGVGMPLCHNLIEALAAGSIPILQYADYLPQPLEDKVNCLTFHDSISLEQAIRSALAMTTAEIQKLRGNVYQYYQQFLAPGRFVKHLFNGPQTLLINAYRMPRIPAVKHIWIVNESSQGHIVQSRGLVREISKLIPIFCHEVQGRLILENRLTKSITKKVLRYWRLKWLLCRSHILSAIPSQSPDLIISSGPRSLTALKYFAGVYNSPSVFVQGTIDVPLGFVDVIMRPFEGEMRDDFIFIPVLFNEVTKEAIQIAKAKYLENEEREKSYDLKALFIGASSSKIQFSRSDWDAIGDFVNRSWKEDGIQWLIATSARTSKEVENLLRGKIKMAAIYDAVWYSCSPRKITNEFLGLADTIYVTMDSLTMVSEAIASGRPVTVICPEILTLDLPNTHRKFIEDLANDGVIQLQRPPFLISPAPFTGTIVDNTPAVVQLLHRIGWLPDPNIRP